MSGRGVGSRLASAIHLWSGQLVDERFEVLAPLGAGGGGVVFRVRELQSQQELALKILSPSHASGRSLTRFVREYRVASRLKDPRLVQAHHFGRFQDSYYFTMDLVEGGSLSTQVKGAKLPPGLAAGLVLQLLGALDAVHHLNITHRDVKPLNLLLEGPLPLPLAGSEESSQPRELPRLRLTDFGIARFGDLDDEFGVGDAPGTPRYIAPEMLTSSAGDPRVDLYATGLVFCELLTGQHPLSGTGDTKGLIATFFREGLQVETYAQFPSDLPPKLVSLIRRLLSRDPGRRPRTAALVYDEIWAWWREARPPYLLPEQKPLRGSPFLAAGALVGREFETARINEFLETSFDSVPLPRDNTLGPSERAACLSPSILVIDGVPGVGKSRLTRHVLRVAHALGAENVTGQCKVEAAQVYEGLVDLLDLPDQHDTGSGRALAAAGASLSPGYLSTSLSLREETETLRLRGERVAALSTGAVQQPVPPKDDSQPPSPPAASPLPGGAAGGADRSVGSGEGSTASRLQVFGPGIASPPSTVTGKPPPLVSEDTQDRKTAVPFPWRRLPKLEDREYELLRREAADGVEAIKQHELRQRFLFEYSAARLLRAAERQPTLVVVEDLQWADPSTSSFLAFLVRAVALARGEGYPGKIAFCLTLRPTQDALPVQRLEAMLAHQETLEQPPVRLHVQPLSSDQGTELVAALLMEPLGQEIQQFCQSLFGDRPSTPLYVEQVLRCLLYQGQLVRGCSDSAGRWLGKWNLAQAATPQAQLPATVQEAMGERAARLSVNTQAMMALASVIGRRFESDLLVHALGLHVHEVLDCLDEAMASGFVVSDDRGSADLVRAHGRYYVFVHDHYRDSLDQRLDQEQRAVLHRQVARSIAALQGEGPGTAERLFYHWGKGGDDVQAARFAVMAADAALEQGAFDQAAVLYEEALSAAERAGVVLDTAVHARYGDALVAQGYFIRASEQYAVRLTSLPQGLERWDVQRRAAELPYRQRDFHRATPPLETLLAELGRPAPPSGPVSWRRLFQAMGHAVTLLLNGWFPNSFFNRRPASDPKRAELTARAQYVLCECYISLDFRRAILTTLECCHRGIRAGEFPFRVIPLCMAAATFSLAGLSRLAQTYVGLAHAALENTIEPGTRAIAFNLLVMVGYFSGNVVLNLIGPALSAGDASGDDNSRLSTRLMAWIPIMASGRIGAARAIAANIRELGQRRHQPEFMGWFFYLEGIHCSYVGRYSDSVRHLNESCRLYAEVGNRMALLGSRINLGLTSTMDPAERSPEELLSSLNSALDSSDEWLKSQFVATDEPALVLLTAAFAVHRLPQVPPETWRRIRLHQRKLRSSCLAMPMLAVIYRGASAALAYRRRKSPRKRQAFLESCSWAKRLGNVSALVYLYRLGALVFAADGELGETCREQAARLVAVSEGIPPLTYSELAQGEIGAGPLSRLEGQVSRS